MTDNWDPPDWLKKKVMNRDKLCVYCHVKLKESPGKDRATLEHIENRPNVEEWNIAMCCNSCNASKSRKRLLDWFESPYCKEKNINKETVADIIKDYIKQLKK